MSKTQVVETVEPRAVATANDQSVAPSQMIAVAVQNGQPLDYIRELMQMEREYKADKAREAFYVALAEFKKVPVQVVKDKTNNQYNSSYASIGNQVNTVNAAMAPFGLNTDWQIDQADGKVTVTCIMTHTLGHTKSATMSGPPDKSGAKNELQQIKSTVTYLSLATHQAVTGVVAVDAANLDDDGNAAGAKKNTIGESERKELDRLIRLTNTDEADFLDWAKVERLEDLPVPRYNEARGMLQRKANKQSAALKKKEGAQS